MVTKIAATPHGLKYFVDAAFVRPAADVVADCANGPLKTLLQAADTLQKWVRLPLDHADEFSIYVTRTAAIDISAGCGISTGAPIANVYFSCTGGSSLEMDADSIAFIELRFHHSIDR